MSSDDLKKTQAELKKLQTQIKSLKRTVSRATSAIETQAKTATTTANSAASDLTQHGPTYTTDHIIDLQKAELKAVMQNVVMDDMYAYGQDMMRDPDQLLAQERAKLEDIKATRPKFMADMCFHVVSAKGVGAWADEVETVKFQELVAEHGMRPLSVVSVDIGQPGALYALLSFLDQDVQRLGAVGFAPESAKVSPYFVETQLTQALEDSEQVVAIGPIGINEHFGPHTIPDQARLLQQQLEIAAAANVPALLWQRGGLEQMQQVVATVAASAEGVPPIIWVGRLRDAASVQWVKQQPWPVAVRPEVFDNDYEDYKKFVRDLPFERLLIRSGNVLRAVPSTDRLTFSKPDQLFGFAKRIAKLRAETADGEWFRALNANFFRALYGDEAE